MRDTRRSLGILLWAVALVGGCGGGGEGAAVEAPLLVLSAVEPASGPTTGGTWIQLSGEGFTDATDFQVLIGGVPATDILVLDGSGLHARTPDGPGGSTDVAVRRGERESVLTDSFCYGTVIFLAGARDDFGTIHHAVYASDVARAVPRLVSVEMPAEPQTGCVRCFRVSRHGHFIAYVADPEQVGFTELHIAVADGSVNLVVSGPVACNDGIGEYAWSPDDTRIAYRATAYGPDRWDLFTTSPHSELYCSRLSPPPVHLDPDAGAPIWSPDGTWVAHVGDLDVEGVYELYVARPDGSVHRKVSGPMADEGDVDAGSVVWSPDSQYVAYLADQDTDGASELYVTTPQGAAPVKVSGPLVASGDVGTGLAWSRPRWSSDGTRLAYVADAETNGVVELYVVSPDGTARTRISHATDTSGSVRDFAWSPVASQLAYLADQEIYGLRELYVVGTDCGCETKVSGTVAPNGRVESFRWAPDGSRIAYVADSSGDLVWRVFTTPPTQPESVLVSTATAERSRLGYYGWTPDSSGVCYTARDDLESLEHYLAPATGEGLVIRLSGPSVPGGGVRDDAPRWLPDGTYAVYFAAHDEAGRVEIYAVRADGTGRRTVSGTLAQEGLEVHPASGVEVR